MFDAESLYRFNAQDDLAVCGIWHFLAEGLRAVRDDLRFLESNERPFDFGAAAGGDARFHLFNQGRETEAFE